MKNQTNSPLLSERDLAPVTSLVENETITPIETIIAISELQQKIADLKEVQESIRNSAIEWLKDAEHFVIYSIAGKIGKQGRNMNTNEIGEIMDYIKFATNPDAWPKRFKNY